jgi:hypothetical protein
MWATGGLTELGNERLTSSESSMMTRGEELEAPLGELQQQYFFEELKQAAMEENPLIPELQQMSLGTFGPDWQTRGIVVQGEEMVRRIMAVTEGESC